MYKVQDIINAIEQVAPISLQESYDNAGLLVGNAQQTIQSALLTIDVTEEVVNEAVAQGAGLIISHHPIIFKGLKRITPRTDAERAIIKAIQHSIAIYAAHTNIDSVLMGVNMKICEKIGLKHCSILHKRTDILQKIIVFVPASHAESVRTAMFTAGAGAIGNYDSCSFTTEGSGTFRALQGATPYIGVPHALHTEVEHKIECIAPEYKIRRILQAMLAAHPYETPAYDIVQLTNEYDYAGSGMIGELPTAIKLEEFLQQLKKTFEIPTIKFAGSSNTHVQKIALCGGAGSFLIPKAMAAGADVFLTGDVSYHSFFIPDSTMAIADIGHFESEQYTKELFYEIINKKFPNFALRFSNVKTNPINYI